MRTCEKQKNLKSPTENFLSFLFHSQQKSNIYKMPESEIKLKPEESFIGNIF